MIDLAAGWRAVIGSPLFGITLTVAAYAIARAIWRRTGEHSLANPVLIAMALVMAVLAIGRVDYATYMVGGQYIAFLLGPATVALAVPLYRQRHRIRQAAPTIIVSVGVGCLAAIASAVLFTTWAGGTAAMVASMAPKSATTPISIALSRAAGGIPELSAVFTIVSGVLGAVAAPAVLTLLRIRDPELRGLAMGVSAHGIGTARSLHDDETEGAFSGLAMGLNALATSLLLPVVLLLLR